MAARDGLGRFGTGNSMRSDGARVRKLTEYSKSNQGPHQRAPSKQQKAQRSKRQRLSKAVQVKPVTDTKELRLAIAGVFKFSLRYPPRRDWPELITQVLKMFNMSKGSRNTVKRVFEMVLDLPR